MSNAIFSNMHTNETLIVLGGDIEQCSIVKKCFEDLGLKNIRPFDRGSEVLNLLSVVNVSVLYLISSPLDMDTLTFVRAARSGVDLTGVPMILVSGKDVILSKDDQSYLSGYDVKMIDTSLHDAGKLHASLVEAFKIKGDPRSLQAKLEVAKKSLQDGMLEKAESIYQEILSETTGSISARIGLMRATAKRPEKSFETLKKLLSQDPKNYNFKIELIERLMANNKAVEAEKLLLELVSELKKNKEIFWLNELGIVCFGRKLYVVCLRIAEHLKNLADKDSKEHAWLAPMLLSRVHLASDNIREAARQLEQAQEASVTERAEIENMRAILARKAGDIHLALQSYAKAFNLAPYDHRIAYNLGLCYEHAANKVEAMKHFKIAVQLAPEFSKAAERLQKDKSETDEL